MVCRRGLNMSARKFALRPAPDLDALVSENLIRGQARYFESSNHWAMAAILWRRVGENEHAEECEAILQRLAENPNIKLPQRKPLIVKGV